MDTLITSTEDFLRAEGFELERVPGAFFELVAQTASAIVLVTAVDGPLSVAVRSALSALTRPFLSKSFGPKTMEIYVVFACGEPQPVLDVEVCERDVRVFRKIVVSPGDDVERRLAVLRPIERATSIGPDIESAFWQGLAAALGPGETDVLKRLQAGDLSVEDLARVLEGSE